MRYTLKNIFDKRLGGEGMSARPSELFVPINFLGKIISPYPAFLFLNLGIRPDWVTFFSISCIIVSASFFIVGHPVSGVIALLCFFMLDSVDGDMAPARLVWGRFLLCAYPCLSRLLSFYVGCAIPDSSTCGTSHKRHFYFSVLPFI